MSLPNSDEYGTVENGPETYKFIASLLVGKGAILIAWTDGLGSQFDILMKLGAYSVGPVQGGIRNSDLFVAIMRVGAFGFDSASDIPLSSGYVDEKLGGLRRLGDVTGGKLAELISGVRSSIHDLIGSL